MTPAQQQMTATNRTKSQELRRPDEILSCEEIDAIVLQAALDGCDAAQIRERLREARDAARERVSA